MDTETIWAVFGLGSAVTIISILLIVTDAFQTTQRQAWQGNVDAVGEFIIIVVVAMIAIALLRLVNPGSR